MEQEGGFVEPSSWEALPTHIRKVLITIWEEEAINAEVEKTENLWFVSLQDGLLRKRNVVALLRHPGFALVTAKRDNLTIVFRRSPKDMARELDRGD
jgi:hypothetical protein